MKLSHCDHETVLYVAKNMREADKEEIYALRWQPNPFLLTNDVMAQSNFAWVGWHAGRPCAVFGGAPTHPGVWQMFMFATDDFPRIGLGLTRFCLKTGLPLLFGELGARRLEAKSHINHTQAHRWLGLLGARIESRIRAFGADGSDYLQFVLFAPEVSTNQKNVV